MKIKEWLVKNKIKFKDINLIQQAFMHSSYVNEHREFSDNERLEFMGDAVLQLWVSNKLFKVKPILNEGDMTTFRAQLVCEQALAIYSRELKLNDFLLLGTGEEKSGGRDRDSILADMFEAFIGAIYQDSGIKSVTFILEKVISKRITNPEKIKVNIDYKTKLQEFIQSDSRKMVIYELVSSKGPSNSPLFEVAVKMDDLILGRGKGNSKKKAEQEAAKDAFTKMVR